jgi:hypothetical protein
MIINNNVEYIVIFYSILKYFIALFITKVQSLITQVLVISLNSLLFQVKVKKKVKLSL